MSTFILGAIVGILVAVLALYWNQIQSLYAQKDTIGAVNQIYTGFQTLGAKL